MFKKTKIKKERVKFILMLILIVFFLYNVKIFAYEPSNERASDNAILSSGSTTLVTEDNAGSEEFDIISYLKTKLYKHQRFSQKLNEKIDKTKTKILELGDQITTLNGQLDLLKSQIEFTKDKITNITEQIYRTENVIRRIGEDIETKKLELEEQNRLLAKYMELLYYHKNKFYSIDYNEINPLKLLLDNDNISSAFKERIYLLSLEEYGWVIMDKIENTKKEFELKNQQLSMERLRFISLHKDLEKQRNELDIQRQGKQMLLDQTKGQKEVFEQMFNDTITQQIEAQNEIRVLNQNIEYFDQKIQSASSPFSADEYEEILKIREDFKIGDMLHADGQIRFPIWPVEPSLGISAYFNDSGYKQAFKVDHYALDIPTLQRTPVVIPQDGIILKTADNGYGYSYIISAHRNNIITLYGHVNQILVKQGEFVRAGQIIALSGGAIGTLGAGVRTTGPHLHFEVHQNGVKGDPLNYLPLSSLPIEAVPASKIKEYLAEKALEEEKVLINSQTDTNTEDNITPAIDPNTLQKEILDTTIDLDKIEIIPDDSN